MNSAIASEVFWGQRPGEDAFQIDIRIGTPYQVGDDPQDWACPVEVLPLYPGIHDAQGTSSLQALCLASSIAFELLQAFKEREGDLFHSPGENVSLESYAFGIATRQEDH